MNVAPALSPQPSGSAELETAEDWAYRYIVSTDLAYKLNPPPLPTRWQHTSQIAPSAPGRPSCLRVTHRRQRRLTPEGLQDASARARLIHVFFHHELQAAELMCWATLRFCDSEPEFRRGMLAICLDEIRHMRLYQDHLHTLGHRVGDFTVRDWFWERVPTCAEPINFVALMGLGLEAANLEHAERFSEWFRQAGDATAASIQERVGREEVAHVAFARRWFEHWTGELTFEAWVSSLPPPLSPLLMRGAPLNRLARRKAGIPEDFLTKLDAWTPLPRGS